jgi:uncharacterized membrane protein YfcA
MTFSLIPDSPGWWAVIGAVFVLAGFVKGVVGLGLPTVAIGLLGLWMAPAQAAALLVVPSIVTNAWQLALGGRLGPLLRRLGPMQAGVALATFGGIVLLGAPQAGWATVALGAVLTAYAVLGLLQWRPRAGGGRERWMGPLVGLATGLVTATTGVFMVPAVPYLQALGLERDELVQALGLSFTVSTLSMAAGLAVAGALSPSVAGHSLGLLLPALAGMGIGQAVRRRVSAAVFRRCFLAGVLLLGLHLMLQPLTR